MKLKYKVGDKVKIRSDLKIGSLYRMKGDGCKQRFVLGMESELGKTHEITLAHCHGYNLDNVGYFWTDEMFEEKVEEKFPAKFKVGDKVKIIRSNVGGSDSPDLGRIVTISTVRRYEDKGRLLDYEVNFGECLPFTHCGEDHENRHFRYYREVELEKVEEKKDAELPAWRTTPGKYSIMIHSDGDVTTLELHDRKTVRCKSKVSVKRHFKDDFDLLAAVRYGLDKLADDLTKKETFKPGDIVEILSAKANGLPVGIRGELVEKCGENTWAVDLKFKYENTHRCDGRIPDGTGIFIIDDHLKKVN